MADFTGYTAGETFASYGVPVETTTTPDTVNVSLDNLRRTFALKSDKLAELNPNKTPFFTYLAKVRNEPTDDPIFKKMEIRPQWQRRYFRATPSSGTDDTIAVAASTYRLADVRFGTNYTRTGKKTATYVNPAFFLLPKQVLSISNVDIVSQDSSDIDNATIICRVVSVDHAANTYTNTTLEPLFVVTSTGTQRKVVNTTAADGSEIQFTNSAGDFWHQVVFKPTSEGQVIGTAFGEGTSYADSWHDDLTSTEGYAQIFKTACPLFSGTSLATAYRGKPNEFLRVWENKLNEHAMDIEHAVLYGIGRVETSSDQPAAGIRYSWGVFPYLDRFGFKGTGTGVNNAFAYATAGYDHFLDWMEEFTAPEDANDGSKLVLCSRKILKWFNKLGTGFMGNNLLLGSGGGADEGNWSADITQIQGQFGHELTKVKTIFGDLTFMAHPLIRKQYEDMAVVVDMRDVKWRPLQANGISRDTFVRTNVQNPGIDGRVDEIITEAGLEITLPERSAVLRFTS